jgi:hypothetical protein
LIVQDLIAEAVWAFRSGRGSWRSGVLFENYEYRSIDVQPAFERFLNQIVCHHPILISILMMNEAV